MNCGLFKQRYLLVAGGGGRGSSGSDGGGVMEPSTTPPSQTHECLKIAVQSAAWATDPAGAQRAGYETSDWGTDLMKEQWKLC